MTHYTSEGCDLGAQSDRAGKNTVTPVTRLTLRVQALSVTSRQGSP